MIHSIEAIAIFTKGCSQQLTDTSQTGHQQFWPKSSAVCWSNVGLPTVRGGNESKSPRGPSIIGFNSTMTNVKSCEFLSPRNQWRGIRNCSNSKVAWHNNITYYYMEESVLLGTNPLVDSIRHFIRDPSGVFSVCHLCECRIIQWRHDSRLLLLLNRIKAWRAGLHPSATKKLKSLQKNLKTRTRRRKPCTT